ncbi:hypothetical protein NVI2019_NGLDDFDA_03987 (plasmid) [Providencia alcalifaciens]|nr:hypothetical protein NVI2019_NGLDDFDA_03987 [Providencia alcalifaciens]
MLKKIMLASMLISSNVFAQESINIYGPGGPAPAIKENAKIFQDKYGIVVHVTSGPQNKWQEQALDDADIIYSVSEVMLHEMKKKFNLSDSSALYMRPVSILVRKKI